MIKTQCQTTNSNNIPTSSGSIVLFYIISLTLFIVSISTYLGVLYNLPIIIIGVCVVVACLFIPIACTITHFPRQVSNLTVRVWIFSFLFIFTCVSSLIKVISECRYAKDDGFVFWPWNSRGFVFLVPKVLDELGDSLKHCRNQEAAQSCYYLTVSYTSFVNRNGEDHVCF